MTDRITSAPPSLTDDALAAVHGGAVQQHGGFPSSITMPDGTVLPLIPLDHSKPGRPAKASPLLEIPLSELEEYFLNRPRPR